MKRTILIMIICLMVVVWSIPAFSAPSEIILKAINTPASYFDLFLFKLYSRWKFEGIGISLKYSWGDNLLKIGLYAKSEEIGVEGFNAADDIKKKQILAEKVDLYVSFLQVIISQLDYTPYQRGYSSKDFDESKFLEEMNQRFEVQLKTTIEKINYEVTRDHNGRNRYRKGPVGTLKKLLKTAITGKDPELKDW